MSKQDEFLAAVRSGDQRRVEEFLAADASLASTNEGGVSAVLLAIYNGRREIARLLIDHGAPVGFFEACAIGDLGKVKEMIASDRSRLTTYSADGYAPFGFATFFGNPEIDRFLLDQGADVNMQARNAQRVGAIHAAAAVCDHEMMKLILSRGADPNARQQMDYTALHTAAGRGDVAMATLLLSHGASRETKASDGKTPADVAREHGHDAFAEWLNSDQPIP